MKKLIVVFALLAVSGIPTLAQERGAETPQFELNADFTFMRWQVPPVEVPPPNYLNYYGFSAGGDYNLKSWLGLALDVSGTYNSQGGVSTSIYTYQAGPRFYPLGHHKLTPYVQGLVGAGSYNVPSGIGPSETKLSFEVGGGVDLRVWRNISWRVGEFDYQWTQFLHGLAALENPPVPANNQNNFKFSSGVVIRFGEK